MRPGMPLRSRERKLVDVTDQAEGRPEKRIEHQGSKDSEGSEKIHGLTSVATGGRGAAFPLHCRNL